MKFMIGENQFTLWVDKENRLINLYIVSRESIEELDMEETLELIQCLAKCASELSEVKNEHTKELNKEIVSVNKIIGTLDRFSQLEDSEEEK